MKKNTSNIKNCLIKNCPAFKNYECTQNGGYCHQYECVLKQCLKKSFDRCYYINRKLSNCLGYSEQEKRIRYEEHRWLVKEFMELLNIEVESNENQDMVEESLEQNRN